MKSRVAHRFERPRSVARSDRAPRILTAVPICDGHDSAVVTVSVELARHGVEVVYLGFHRSIDDIVRAAIQEDVQGIGLSSYNGGHIEFFSDVLSRLRRRGAEAIRVFGGGGGTITPDDAKQMRRRGVSRIFFPGAALTEMVEWVKSNCRRRDALSLRQGNHFNGSDLRLAKSLSAVEAGVRIPDLKSQCATSVVGITGPGGAGKTTLIDELVFRFLERRPRGRLAILSHDPGGSGAGALLGDRAALLYAQNDRVFMRSLAARGQASGLSTATRGCLKILRLAGFDVVLVESAGIGQETLPFVAGLVDKQVLAMSPEYGSTLQLQKIAMLDKADIVVLNKADLPGARTAVAEIEQRLAINRRGQKLFATVAKRHRDPGVDELFREVLS